MPRRLRHKISGFSACGRAGTVERLGGNAHGAVVVAMGRMAAYFDVTTRICAIADSSR